MPVPQANRLPSGENSAYSGSPASICHVRTARPDFTSQRTRVLAFSAPERAANLPSGDNAAAHFNPSFFFVGRLARCFPEGNSQRVATVSPVIAKTLVLSLSREIHQIL